MGRMRGTQVKHRHVQLYNPFWTAGIEPEQLWLTSRVRDAPRLHYNPPIRQRRCFQHLHTPSLPIQSPFHPTVMGLITPLLCEAADRRAAVRRERERERERKRTLTQGTGAGVERLSALT